MGQEIPTSKDLAILVLSNELGVDPSVQQMRDGIQKTFETLNVHLSARLGIDGYRALLKRSVLLAGRDVPWLASVYVAENGNIEGLIDAPQSESMLDGCQAILARVIELLDTFIGRNLTARILQSAWPDSVITGTAGEQGESNG